MWSCNQIKQSDPQLLTSREYPISCVKLYFIRICVRNVQTVLVLVVLIQVNWMSGMMMKPLLAFDQCLELFELFLIFQINLMYFIICLSCETWLKCYRFQNKSNKLSHIQQWGTWVNGLDFMEDRIVPKYTFKIDKCMTKYDFSLLW